jgi:hypothetical protein
MKIICSELSLRALFYRKFKIFNNIFQQTFQALRQFSLLRSAIYWYYIGLGDKKSTENVMLQLIFISGYQALSFFSVF